MNQKRIVITGGHLTPALAVIEKLQQNPNWEIYFLGRKHASESSTNSSVESHIIPQNGIKFYPISAGKLQRKFTLSGFKSFLKIPLGLIQSINLLRKLKPDVVLSFGGYLGLTVSVAAFIQGIPTIIHEQTTLPGLANRISGHFAKKIAISWVNTPFFSSYKTILTGNPIRQEILLPLTKTDNKFPLNSHFPTILITGGNQGSHTINNAVIAKLPDYQKIANIIFQTGNLNLYHDYELAVKSKAKSSSTKIYIQKFFYPGEYGEAMKKADLIVGRAGANTVTEIAYLEKPAIFIPLPWSGAGEQMQNAKLLIEFDSQIIDQNNLTPDNLYKTIETKLKSIKTAQKNFRSSKSLVKLDAAEKIAAILDEII